MSPETPFYRYREWVNDGGMDALIDKSKRIPNLKNRVDEATEQAVIEMAIEFTGDYVSVMSLGGKARSFQAVEYAQSG